MTHCPKCGAAHLSTRVCGCEAMKKLDADYDCEDCIGMKEYGCYCMAVGCIAPCTMPPADQGTP